MLKVEVELLLLRSVILLRQGAIQGDVVVINALFNKANFMQNLYYLTNYVY